MVAPTPLTLCPVPQLDWSRPGIPAAADFGDIYFSTDGGLAETQAVFLHGCGLPEGWQDDPHPVIGETGFGTGLNFLATCQMWAQSAPSHGSLHYISIEKFPLSRADLRRALSQWPELATDAARLIDLWPGRVPGIHRIHISNTLTLTLYHMDIETALQTLNTSPSPRIKYWFLDGFSPARNPDMWQASVMTHIAGCSAPQARLASFSVAGEVRRGLIDAGFEVFKRPGFGRKRHRLEAQIPPVQISPPSIPPTGSTTPRPSFHPIIIGGGIGGACLARSFLRRGIIPTVIDKDPDYVTAASGNPSALVKPRLDLQDRPESRFFLASYLYALNLYCDFGDIQHRGVSQRAKDLSEQNRFDKLVAQNALGEAHMCRQGQDIYFPQALALTPRPTLTSLMEGASHIHTDIADICRSKSGDMWEVLTPSNDVAARGTHVCLAPGADIRTLIKTCAALQNHPRIQNLRFSRGQLTWAQWPPDFDKDKSLSHPLAYGGYAVPIDADILLGATHARLDESNPYLARPEDDTANQDGFKAVLGYQLSPSHRASRASVRVTTPSTLPLMDRVDDTVCILSGLGSRGFVFAPLLAESLVAQLTEEPVPLDPAFAAKMQLAHGLST